MLASLGFKYYVASMGAYVETYGAIGGVMVLMLWFYISGLAILIGAEMNAEIEHASPYGKDAGEKVPGQKRKIGAAAMRAWVARRRKHGEKPPSAEEIKDAVGPTPPDKEPGAPTAEPPRVAIAPIGAGLAPTAPKGHGPEPNSVPAFASARRRARARALDALVGASLVIAAQAWLALKLSRKLRT